MNKPRKKSTLFVIVFSILLLGLLSGLLAGTGRADAQTDEVPFQLATLDETVIVKEGDREFTYDLYVRIPPEHFLYKEKTEFEIIDDKGAVFWTGVEWPETTLREDPFLNKTAEVWSMPELVLPLRFEVKDISRLPALVSGTVVLQGCSENLCFRPVKRVFRFEVKCVGAEAIALDAPTAVPQASFSRTGSPFVPGDGLERLFSQNILLGAFAAFIGGVLTDFTPCVLPLIPLILLFIGVQREGRPGRNALLAFMLVMGMSTTYIVLGLAAVLFGWNLGFVFQSQWFLAILAFFFLVMALSLFDVFSIQLPHRLQTRLTQMGGKGLRGGFTVGMTVGLVALPCVGPVVGALLLYVAASRDWLQGAFYLWAYGLGMGSLFILAALFYGKGRRLFERSRWTVWIKKSLGLLFMVLSLYYGGILVKGLVVGRASEGAELVNGWYTALPAGIAEAKRTGKPIVIDFRADWCLPCLEMEETTFKDARVVRALAEDVVAVRLDCTTSSETCDGPASDYDVIGFPTLLFLDSEGRPIPALPAIHGYVGADDLLKRLDALKK